MHRGGPGGETGEYERRLEGIKRVPMENLGQSALL